MSNATDCYFVLLISSKFNLFVGGQFYSIEEAETFRKKQGAGIIVKGVSVEGVSDE